MTDIESRMLALLRYALDNPSETFRKADGMQWLWEASELVTVLEKPQQCPHTWAFSPREDWRCQLDTGHAGRCQWPDPALTIT